MQRRLFFGSAGETACAVILGLLLVGAFAPTLGEMAYEWFAHPDYGHGVLMPPVAAWVLWDRRKQLAALKRRGGGAALGLLGALALVPLAAFLLLGEMKLSWFLKPFAFVGSLTACIAVLWGWQGLRALRVPLVVLALMCPIPWRILIWATLPLKRHAAVLATGLMDITGLDASLQGNLINVPGITSMWIADACSGVRSLVSLLSIAVLACLFWRRHWLAKAVVIVSCVPIAVAVNGIRIWLTAVLAKFVSPDAAQGFFHLFEGFVLFLVAALILLGWAWLVNRLAPRREDAPADEPREETVRTDRPRLRYAAAGFAALLLAVGAFGVYRVRAQLSETGADGAAVARMQAALQDLPLEIPGYHGEKEEWDDNSVAASGADAYGAVTYEDAGGQLYHVFVGGALRNADNFHTPNVCMPSAGWEMLDSRRVDLEPYRTAGATPRMQRIVLQMGGDRMLSYFWFQSGDRLADDEWTVRLYRLLDLLKGDPLSPTVIVSIYVPIRQDVEATEAAALRFLSTIAPFLRDTTNAGGVHG